MNVLKTTLATALFSAAPFTFAANDSNGFFVWADVTDVNPIVSTAYERVPVERCTMQSRTVVHEHSQAFNRYEQQPRYNGARGYRQSGPGQSAGVLPTLLGGVVGGAIGNQFGGGNGKKALTALGAIVGASVAASASNQREPIYVSSYNPQPVYETRPTKVCETSYELEETRVVEGYQVSYQYMGRQFERTTDTHPGDRVKVYVTVDPVSNRRI